MEEQRFDGEWWVPGSDERKSGTLTWKPKDIARLELHGTFPVPGDSSDSNGPPETIFGISRSGELLTLTQTIDLGTNQATKRREDGWETHDSAHLGAGLVFLGRHVSEGAAAPVRKVRLQAPLLDEWVGASPFSFERSPSGRTTLTYGSPEPIELKLSDGNILVWTGIHEQFGIGHVKLDSASHIDIERGAPAPFKEYWGRSVGPAINFLSFATHHDVSPSHISVYLAGESDEKEVPVLLADLVNQTEEPPLRPDGMLLGHYAPERGIPDLLRSWFELPPDRHGARDVFVSLLASNSLYGEERFLLLTSAIEAFWHSDLAHTVFTRDEYRARMARVLDAVPTEFHEWVKPMLAHGNDPPQRERLREVCRYAGDDAWALLGNAESFLASVVSTRNYLVHVDPDRTAKAERDPARLHWICAVLSIVVEFCILSQLEVPAALRAAIPRRYGRYGAVKEHLRKEPLFP